MKFIHTALAAASLIVVAPAFAGLAPAGTGEGELFLVMYDEVKEVSFTLDLGVGAKAFRQVADLTRPTGTFSTPVTASAGSAANYSQSWGLNGADGTEFDKFTDALGDDTSSVRWFVVGADGLGSVNGNARSIVTTVTNGASTAGFTSPLVQTSHTAFDNYAILMNQYGDEAMMGDATLNGSAFGSKALNNYVMSTGSFFNNGGNTFNFTADNGMGEESEFVYFGRSGTNNLIKDLFNNTQKSAIGHFSIAQSSNGEYALNYALVPEPSTYALLIAGLAAVGFVARRRQA